MSDLAITSLNSSWVNYLCQHRLIAVIRCDNFGLALSMAKAIASAGISLIEVTWNSSQPQLLVSQLKAELPNCVIGVGTILTLEQLKDAINCGAEFVFSPHVHLPLIELALAMNIPIIPGALSPTEIVTAYHAGASSVKVFPIQAVGGVNYIKTLQGPLTKIPLIPTGGVTFENAVDFIKAGAIAVGLSSQLFPSELLLNQDWVNITRRASILQQNLLELR
jgi:2-dehydro-3-deoxyphosphogluconate aldolase/(4S)-4-hydroxy-2-oxoglutarate aldolase